MAIALSHIMSEISGSVAGINYRKGNYGSLYLSAKSAGRHSANPVTSRFWLPFATGISIWSHLNSHQKNLWIDLSHNYPGLKRQPLHYDTRRPARLLAGSMQPFIRFTGWSPAVGYDVIVPPHNWRDYLLTEAVPLTSTSTTISFRFRSFSAASWYFYVVRSAALPPTVNSPPGGFNSRNSVWVSSVSSTQSIVTLTNLVPNRRYFVRFSVYRYSTNWTLPIGSYLLRSSTTP